MSVASSATRYRTLTTTIEMGQLVPAPLMSRILLGPTVEDQVFYTHVSNSVTHVTTACQKLPSGFGAASEPFTGVARRRSVHIVAQLLRRRDLRAGPSHAVSSATRWRSVLGMLAVALWRRSYPTSEQLLKPARVAAVISSLCTRDFDATSVRMPAMSLILASRASIASSLASVRR